MTKQMTSITAICICADKPMQFWMVVSAPHPVHLNLFVENIPPRPERISLAQRIRQCASGTQRLAPHVVLVFYHEGTRTVKQANDIALQIVGISIKNTVVADLCAS